MMYRVMVRGIAGDGPWEGVRSEHRDLATARNALVGAAEDEAEHWHRHRDLGGRVGVAPIAPGAYAVQLWDGAGQLEVVRVFAVKS